MKNYLFLYIIILGRNVMKLSPIKNNFRGIYLSNSLAPGKQRNRAKQIQRELIQGGLSEYYENHGKDILITPAKYNGVRVDFVPYRIDRILDDNFSRWSGKIN